MDDVYLYRLDLPSGVHEMVAPCADGSYTVYVSTRDTRERQMESYQHAIRHVQRRDHEKEDVQATEMEAHERREV
jgi:hypothetical protein